MCFFAKKKGRVPREVPFPKSDKWKIRSISFVSWHGDQFANNYSFLKVSHSFKSCREAKLAFNEEMKNPWSLSSLVPQPIKQTMRPHPSSGYTVQYWMFGRREGGGGISLLSINHHLSTRGHHHHQSPSPLPASGSSFFTGEGGVGILRFSFS